ncbi:MAG: flagellar hook-length control protein FliK [Treponema sp.]|jgi:hypothetical protein|nr:flagellar hook-length control protein FliK [Treponema sp.]
MLDISPQISDTSAQERIHPESAGSVKKGRSKDTGSIGAFGRLLAGLLRKNQTVQPRETEHSALSLTPVVSKEDKKTKPVLAGFRIRETEKKRDAEELVSSRKPPRPEKAQKKADHEELSPVETMAVTADAGTVAAANTADAAGAVDAVAGSAPENRPGKAAGKEAVFGAEGKKQEKTGLSPEKTQFSPVFSGKKPEQAEETRREGAKSEGPGGNRNRRKDRITVEDQRTPVSRETPPDLRVQEPSHGMERELTVEPRPAGERSLAGEKAFAGEGRGAETGPGGFADLLAEQLAGDLSPDIVKQAAIVLKDGGAGTIRLSLKPETLGKVKIHLEMAENKISGHIFVENEEALRAFEKEVHTLEQAFRDSGFADASLDLSGNGGRGKGDETGPFFSGRFAASSYDSVSEPGAFSGISGGGFSTVDLLV